jgi:hypothetical protein
MRIVSLKLALLAGLAAAATAAPIRTRLGRVHARGPLPPRLNVSEASDCGTSADLVRFSSISIKPDPPVKGSPAVLNSTATASGAVEAGTFAMSVAINGMSLYSTQGNACGHSDITLPLGMGSVGVDGLPCPVTAGQEVHIAASLTLPQQVPAGKYEVKVTADTGDGGDASASDGLFCLDLQFPMQ